MNGVCDYDSTQLERRSDDNESTALHRLKSYKNQIQPLVEHYDKIGILHGVAADAPAAAIAAKVQQILWAEIESNNLCR